MCFVAGTKVKTFDGNLYPVLSAERFYPTEDVKVYNFRVADWHTYYVSEIGILVHNDKCGPDVARRSESGKTSTTGENSRIISDNLAREGRAVREGEAAAHIVASSKSKSAKI